MENIRVMSWFILVHGVSTTQRIPFQVYLSDTGSNSVADGVYSLVFNNRCIGISVNGTVTTEKVQSGDASLSASSDLSLPLAFVLQNAHYFQSQTMEPT